MSYLHPFEPLVPRPALPESLCLDRRSEEARFRELERGSRTGLSRLIAHPLTPETGQRGIEDGLWAPAGRAGIYLHREDYILEGGGVQKTRWSVVATLDPETCPLGPVVEPRRIEVERTVESLQKAKIDPGGICALYRDQNHHLEKLIEARKGIPPLLTLGDSQGGRHWLWLLSEAEGEAVCTLIERCGAVVVGDVAAYHALLALRDLPGFSPRIRPIVRFFHQRDFGITFASTARIHARFDGFDVNQFLAHLHREHEVNEFPLDRTQTGAAVHREFFDHLRTEGITRRVVGVLIAGVPTAFQVAVPEDDETPASLDSLPGPVREFDAEWVRHGLVAPFFPPEAREPLQVLSDPRQAPDIIAAGEGQVAFVLNPPPKRFIPQLAEVGWRLPTGALQFQPPVPRGFLLSPLESEAPVA